MKLFLRQAIQGKKLSRELSRGVIQGFARFALAVLLPSISVGTWAAEPGDEVVGLWNTGGSLLKISRGDAGGLSAELLVLDKAVYTEGEPNGPVGSPRRDDMNPDPKLQERSLVGIDLLSEYAFNGKKWEGKIYDPESGKTYSSNMRVDKDGVLKMRGYIGAPMFGRTTQFRSAALCDASTVTLLRAGQLPGCE